MGARRINTWLLNLGLLGISVGVALLLMEVAVRQVVDPVDYLLPTVVQHPNLGHNVAEGTGGHDDWGFRNRERPNRAQIVAIGDSMTYGIAARAQESWPAVLQELTGRSTYNMGLGAYGPLQYLYLLRERAMELQPETVVVGIYLGNDLLDVFNLAYQNDNWAEYRLRDLGDDNASRGFVIDQPQAERGGLLSGFRNYLARVSVLYRLVTSLPILDRFRAVNVNSVDAGMYVFSLNGQATILTPSANRELMEVGDPQVDTAIEITKRAILEMNEIAADANIEFKVLMVPTKELVYSDVLSESGEMGAHPDMEAAIRNEEAIRADLFQFLGDSKLSYVDPLPVLREALRTRVIYPFNDGHPNAAGYRLIAEQIAAALAE